LCPEKWRLAMSVVLTQLTSLFETNEKGATNVPPRLRSEISLECANVSFYPCLRLMNNKDRMIPTYSGSFRTQP